MDETLRDLDLDPRKLVAELLGTFLLVVFAVGVATLSFGFGATGGSLSAGVVATALAFGLTLLALAYAIGPISGCHVNPAVTLGVFAAGRMSLTEAIGYWAAQFIGGIAGALTLWGIFEGSPRYDRSTVGLGADGYDSHSIVGINLGGAFAVEVVLTFLFVLVVLAVTSRAASQAAGGVAIGLALAVVHLFGIPLTGTSVNPARSLGPAIVVGGAALSQVWLFLVAPLVGAVVAAAAARYLIPEGVAPAEITLPEAAAELTAPAAPSGRARTRRPSGSRSR